MTDIDNVKYEVQSIMDSLDKLLELLDKVDILIKDELKLAYEKGWDNGYGNGYDKGWDDRPI